MVLFGGRMTRRAGRMFREKNKGHPHRGKPGVAANRRSLFDQPPDQLAGRHEAKGPGDKHRGSQSAIAV